MDIGELTGLVAVLLAGLTVLVPVVGLTARFAFKPLVEALIRARNTPGSEEAISLLDRRMALLEQEMQGLGETRRDVDRLMLDRDFRQRLVEETKR